MNLFSSRAALQTATLETATLNDVVNEGSFQGRTSIIRVLAPLQANRWRNEEKENRPILQNTAKRSHKAITVQELRHGSRWWQALRAISSCAKTFLRTRLYADVTSHVIRSKTTAHTASGAPAER